MRTRQAVASLSPQLVNFEPAWSEDGWFAALHVAQHGICVWCASGVRGSPGTIEHIRPKAEVTRALRTPGEEIDAPGHRRGRSLLPGEPLKPGYYTQAYEPDNLAYACERCQSWKSTLWPVVPRTGPWCAPSPGLGEEELVLDPFAPGFDPLLHFRFTPSGEILARPGDVRAEVTIEVLGLDRRETLCKQRRDLYQELLSRISSIRHALSASTLTADEKRVLPHVAVCCAWSSSHAAFYRAALRHELAQRSLPWVQINQAWTNHGQLAIKEPAMDTWLS